MVVAAYKDSSISRISMILRLGIQALLQHAERSQFHLVVAEALAEARSHRDRHSLAVPVLGPSSSPLRLGRRIVSPPHDDKEAQHRDEHQSNEADDGTGRMDVAALPSSPGCIGDGDVIAAGVHRQLLMWPFNGHGSPCRLCFNRLLSSRINSYGIMNLPLLNLYLWVFHRSAQKSPLVPTVLQFVLSLPKPPPAWGMSSLNVLFQSRPAGG